MRKILVIFLFLFTLSIPYSCSTAGSFRDDGTRLLDTKSFSTSPGKTLTIKGMSGSLDIKTSSGNRVEIKIYGNEIAARELNLEAFETSDGVSVNENFNHSNKNRQVNIITKYEIIIPSGYNAKISTVSGDLNISGLNGSLNFSSASGNLKASDLKGELKVSTASGDISVNNSVAEIKITSASGDVNCSSNTGNATITTASGDVFYNGTDSKLDITSASGDVSLSYSGTNKGINVNSFSGDVSLQIPSRFPSDIYVNTMNGSLDLNRADFKVDSSEKNLLKGSIDGGGKELKISTMSGSIKIRKN